MSASRKDGTVTDLLQRIETAMHKRGIRTYYDLAQKCGLSPGTIGGWKHARSIPQQRTLQILSDVLGVSVQWLDGTDNSEPNWDRDGTEKLENFCGVLHPAREGDPIVVLVQRLEPGWIERYSQIVKLYDESIQSMVRNGSSLTNALIPAMVVFAEAENKLSCAENPK